MVNHQVRHVQQGFVAAQFAVGIEMTLRNHLRELTVHPPRATLPRQPQNNIGDDGNPVSCKINHFICFESHFVTNALD